MACSRNTRFLLISLAVAALSACGKNDDVVTTAQNTIFQALRSQGIYERGNLPVDNPPTPEQIKGRFDIIGGAYRHIVNEERANRGSETEYGIDRGDSITFMFDARIYSGGTFESQQTFYTNIASRIQEITNNNPDFVTQDGAWPTVPLKIKVGEDPGILKSLQEALIGGPQECRAGDPPRADGQPGEIVSDQVRVYLTSDLAFGNKTVYNVPRNSTLVFEITDIVIVNKIRN